MSLRLLPLDKLTEFVTRLANSATIFYPFLEGNKTHLTKFLNDETFYPHFTKIRTAQNIKHFFFPSRDAVAKFPGDFSPRISNQYLFGIKACDLRGLAVYDKVFVEWHPVDPFYKERREKTTIISCDCPEPEESCFCSLVGIYPYPEGIADLNFTVVSSGYLFEAFDTKGTELLKNHADLFQEPSPDDEKDRATMRGTAVKKLQKINSRKFKEKLPSLVAEADKKSMREARDECVECFGCLHACPTCYCFLLGDYKKAREVERLRVWDACYYAAYARVGGGANPRSKFDDRFWNRFQCKFNFFHQYEKFYACSGCGRCLTGCSAQIDIREILWKL